jgi:hypothetical protein
MQIDFEERLLARQAATLIQINTLRRACRRPAMRSVFEADQRFRPGPPHPFARFGRRIAMTLETALVVAAIVLAFAIFGCTLAWADYNSTHAGKSHG